MAIYANHDTVFYFDSYGVNPSNDSYIMSLINSFGRQYVVFSNVQIQSLFSYVCGLYCIYFLYIMSKKMIDFDNFIDLFINNCNINDDNIRCVFSEIFVKFKKTMI